MTGYLDIVTYYGLGNWASIPDRDRLALVPTQPPIQWVPGTPSLEVNWSKYEADHLPPCSAVRKVWSFTCTSDRRDLKTHQHKM
jgi:hypothetical protein